ncbi:MAG: nucleoside transporter C-terminal domain-containing protein [Gammaproteobacteria bacterium]|nr:nucleoside transporter C-terminal domain-containing protein [Gammaproteobacteria bacterium]
MDATAALAAQAVPGLQSLAGIIILPLMAWAASERRDAFVWRVPAAGLAVQFVLALVLLKVPLLQGLFVALNELMLALQAATRDGTAFVFGYLGGGEPPFEERPGASSFILAFQALPLVLVLSALSALLFHWRILPALVSLFAFALRRTLNVGGALGVGAAANVFVGMVEAPLLVRPYIARLTRAELFALMTCGMATIAGTVMVLYASVLAPILPDAMAHILTASIISAPAAITVARLMVPDAGTATPGDMADPDPAAGPMDAITRGTLAGLELLLNIVAMLIVLVALVSLVNLLLGGLSLPSLQALLGFLMAPVVWLMGIPWNEAVTAGSLMGIKTVLNELLAYAALAELPAGALGERSTLIMTYALCGFANFGSLGIMIGGLATMAPQRRTEIVGLGFKAVVAGTLATCLTGAVVGVVTLI